MLLRDTFTSNLFQLFIDSVTNRRNSTGYFKNYLLPNLITISLNLLYKRCISFLILYKLSTPIKKETS